MLGAEFEREVAGEVQCRCFGGGVAEGCVFAEGADADTCYAACDYDAGWVVDGGGFAEEGCESFNVITPSVYDFETRIGGSHTSVYKQTHS